MSKGLFDCTGKVTMVTGGNGGIGLGFAMGVAKMGGDVAIWARNEEKNAAAKAMLEQAGAGRRHHLQGRCFSEEQILAGYDQLMKDFGRSIVCSPIRAARPIYDSVFDMPTSAWHEFQSVALHGAFLTLREGARQMVKRAEGGEPGGSLVPAASLSLFQGLAGKQNYAASKAGIAA